MQGKRTREVANPSREEMMEDFFSAGEGPDVLHFDCPNLGHSSNADADEYKLVRENATGVKCVESRLRATDVKEGTGNYHIPSVPLILTENFPRAPYRSRGTVPKSTIHWGQRKLFMSEMQLMTLFCEPYKSYWIVYVGAAPGSHLLFLDKLFDSCQHQWELVDPGAYNDRLVKQVENGKKNFLLRNEYFDNSAAYDLVAKRLVKSGCPGLSRMYRFVISIKPLISTDGCNAEHARTTDVPIRYEEPAALPIGLHLLCYVANERTRMLFLSDIRSGREDNGNFEEHVAENNRAQEAWVDIINPTFAMLKFRLPYTYTSRYSFELKKQVVVPNTGPPATLHSDGHIILPIWTRPTSTETRLVVPQWSKKKSYDHQKYENQMFFFNAVLRERVHFNHIFDGEAFMDHRFDSSAELSLLAHFVCLYQLSSGKVVAEELRSKVLSLVKQITCAIGGSFDRAISNRDNIHITKGNRAGWSDHVEKRLAAAEAIRSMPIWWRSVSAQDCHTDAYMWDLFEVQQSSSVSK